MTTECAGSVSSSATVQTRIARLSTGLFLAVVLASAVLCTPTLAADKEAPDAKVGDFVKMLGDPDIQNWLQEQASSDRRADASPERAAMAQTMANWMASLRASMRELAGSARTIGPDLAAAFERVAAQTGGAGFGRFLLDCIGLIALGLALRLLLVRTALRVVGDNANVIVRRPAATRVTLDVCIRALGLLGFGVGAMLPVLVFGNAGLWAAMLLSVVIPATAFMAVWDLSSSTGVPPRAGGEARLLHVRRWLVIAATWFAFGYAVSDVSRLAGVSVGGTRLIATCLALGLALILLVAIWRMPLSKSIGNPPGAERLTALSKRSAASLYVVVAWLFWSLGATGLFWLLVVAVALPLLLVGARHFVDRLFPGTASSEPDAAPSLLGATVHAALRIAIIGGCLLILATAWNIGLSDVTVGQTPTSRAARAILTALVTLLAFDVIWQIVRTVIDLGLYRAARAVPVGSPLAIRNARLRTLLPIIRNLVLAFLATLAVLMSLSALGIEIGPLLASAGVMGVAIGFGSQTLVKDVISGIFYLLDDAFRVGEYIVSGSYKGTVESFSLRSVRLRHHRGPVYTIPFGELGSVQNLSRDYVIDKMLLNVAYDADLESARKIIKKIGQELAADPELAEIIIQPLKLQAVSDFGDYGIQLKLKLMTRPGEQFAVRKKALPMIKKAFDESGIRFASPTVRVADGDPLARAAAASLAAGSPAPPVAAS